MPWLHRHTQSALLAALVLSTTAYAAPPDTSLSTAGASFLGEATHDSAGGAVAGVGDVDGDGLDDVLVGSWQASPTTKLAGAAYLILGRSTGWTTGVGLAGADASWHGEATQDKAGFEVAGAGDVDGDGLDDLLLGVPFNDEAGADAGQTYLVLGRSTGWTTGGSLAGADASFRGEAAGDQAGYAVDSAGDIDGDGYGDLLIGAWRNQEKGYRAGKSYLIRGSAGGWSMDVDLGGAADSFVAEASSDWSGSTLAGAGDVDGDGLDDFLIGASRNDEAGNAAGQTYLFLGDPAGYGPSTPLASADASFLGEAANDLSGWDLAGASDVDGDGLDDLLIGAYGHGLGGSSAGIVYLVLGRTGGWAMDTSLAQADASFHGEEADDKAGWRVDLPGDVDGDGLGDLLITASWNGEASWLAGQVYLVWGRTSGWTTAYPLAHANASFWGEWSEDVAGRDAAGAGDMDGDGFGDLVVGAPGNDEAGDYAGKAYLVFGEPGCTSVDDDGDGFVDMACFGDDCDDDLATVHPGAPEICDLHDNDCDGLTDDADPDVPDGDGDGVPACTDCDDGDPMVSPDEPEICDGVDNDCDGLADGADPDIPDGDGDGSSACDDCDDGDPLNSPDFTETCDGADNDCDGNVGPDEVDADGDGFMACWFDCDDTDAAIHPDTPEVCDDGVDNDCDGSTDGDDVECSGDDDSGDDDGGDDDSGDDDSGDDDTSDDDDTTDDDTSDDDTSDDDTVDPGGELEPADCSCGSAAAGAAAPPPGWLLVLAGMALARRYPP